MVGITLFASLHIIYWDPRNKLRNEKRNNVDVVVNAILCLGPRVAQTEKFRNFVFSSDIKVGMKQYYIYIYIPK